MNTLPPKLCHPRIQRLLRSGVQHQHARGGDRRAQLHRAGVLGDDAGRPDVRVDQVEQARAARRMHRIGAVGAGIHRHAMHVLDALARHPPRLGKGRRHHQQPPAAGAHGRRQFRPDVAPERRIHGLVQDAARRQRPGGLRHEAAGLRFGTGAAAGVDGQHGVRLVARHAAMHPHHPETAQERRGAIGGAGEVIRQDADRLARVFR
ncbi:hypothetical protein WJ977_22590 [Achromobacter xylosoxidans]